MGKVTKFQGVCSRVYNCKSLYEGDKRKDINQVLFQNVKKKNTYVGPHVTSRCSQDVTRGLKFFHK